MGLNLECVDIVINGYAHLIETTLSEMLFT